MIGLMFDITITFVLRVTSLAIGFVSNPVHSVLFLVLTFFASSVALLSLGCEFLALRFMVVYMGAIAVLFRFVVMMLDLKELEENDAYTGSTGLLTLLFFVPSLAYSLTLFTSGATVMDPQFVQWSPLTNVESMSQILYTQYFPLFLVAGFILLVALIAAVVLAVPRPFSKVEVRQDLATQLARDPSDAVLMMKSK